MSKINIMARAKRQKNDEYYTRWCDIEEELVHYEDQLRGKSVICNCDDVEKSNFIEYLCRQAPYIGITKVIGVRYEGPDATESWYVTYTPPEDIENYDADNWKDYLIKTRMTGNGGFETSESIELLDQCDVCITNPPFSIYKEFVDLLIEHNKKFLIIGNKASIGYKNIFKYFKNNKLWCGYRNINKDMWFTQPEDMPYEKEIDGQKVKHIMATWFTNLEVSKRYEPLQLVFSMENQDKLYEKFDFYNAYNVNKVTDIPYDSKEKILAVPITFVGVFNPNQFEILDARDYTNIEKLKNKTTMLIKDADGTINGKAMYSRILIRRRQEEP